MTLPQVYELFDYWGNYPPEHETLATLCEAITTWEPRKRQVLSEADHRASLERRWKAGAMNIKQIWEATGGVISVIAQAAGGQPVSMGGIGPFPGAH
jgi:hypothetical protein